MFMANVNCQSAQDTSDVYMIPKWWTVPFCKIKCLKNQKGHEQFVGFFCYCSIENFSRLVLLSSLMRVFFLIQDEENISSRRRCLACLCAVTLISASGPTFYAPKGFAADMTNKPGIQKAVCRNCGGGGAIICKSYCITLVSFYVITSSWVPCLDPWLVWWVDFQLQQCVIRNCACEEQFRWL